MKRLTKVDGCGENDLIRCFGCEPEKAGKNLEHCGYCEEGWRKALDKLAAYEDTDLSPEEVRYLRWFVTGGIHKVHDGWTHALELVEAEKDERLVVLPCGINDTAWYADKDADRALMGYISSYQILSDGAVYFEFTNIESDVEWVSVELPVDDFGKTVFLTREEAEAALAREGGGNDDQ